MKDIRRKILLLAGGALALAGAYWLFRPAPIAVDVATVRRAALRVTVDEEGETRVRQRYTVAAPTTGRLLRIEVDEGQHVEAGAVVARIEPAPLGPRDLATARARLEAAEATQRAADASVRRSRAALAQAKRDAARAEELYKAGTLSTDAREKAKLAETSAVQESEVARFAADAAAHEVEAARAALLATRAPGEACANGNACVAAARAPVAGQVLRVFEESERIVAAGTPLVEIGDPASLEIVVDILSTDAVRVSPGARVLIDEWGGDGTLAGHVRLVEPSAFTKVSALGVDEQRVNVVADLDAPEARLGDRYRVEARIVIWEGEDVIQVPASALFRNGPDWAVFVVERGTAHLREVEVGHQATFDAEIARGLEVGDTVILHPSDRVHDGARVAATK